MASNTEKGFVHLFPVLLVALFAVGVVALTLSSTKQQDFNKAVLSSDDSDEDNSGSGSSNSGSSNDDEEDSDNSGSGSSSDDREETEVRTGDTRIETRTENDRTRTDIYEDGTKLRIETRDGVTTIKIEDEAEDEDEDEEEQEDEEETEPAEDQVEIEEEDGVFVARRRNVRAQTNFPLSLDETTGELTVTTPAGARVVAVLPDEAVSNLLKERIFDFVTSNDANGDDVSIEFEEENLVYKIEGLNREKLLGLFDIEINGTADVSAETGEVLNVQRSLIERILDFISF